MAISYIKYQKTQLYRSSTPGKAKKDPISYRVSLMERNTIVDVKPRVCLGSDTHAQHKATEAVALPGGLRPDFAVETFTTAGGTRGTSFGFRGLDAKATAHVFRQVKPFFVGRDVFHTQKNLRDFEMFDRRWNLLPIYAYGPFDTACRGVVGQSTGRPVHKVLDATRIEVLLFVSSMFLFWLRDYVAQAREIQALGYCKYKLRPPGLPELDIECYRAVRETVDDDFALTADPVISYGYEQALRDGRELEDLNYRWLEEPFLDVNFHGWRKHHQKIDILPFGTEALSGGYCSSAHYIREGILDIVRTDVSWRGRISRVLKTAHTAESFGAACELHTTINHALERLQIHASLAISNCEIFETLLPFDNLVFGTHTALAITEGMVQAPEGSGLGIDYDWDFVHDHTVLRL